MTYFDVFNGDADGICALTQWRLAHPVDQAERVTGVKRDIALLSRVQAQSGDEVTVLDISLDRNREALERVLEAGGRVMEAEGGFSVSVRAPLAHKTGADVFCRQFPTGGGRAAAGVSTASPRRTYLDSSISSSTSFSVN